MGMLLLMIVMFVEELCDVVCVDFGLVCYEVDLKVFEE